MLPIAKIIFKFLLLPKKIPYMISCFRERKRERENKRKTGRKRREKVQKTKEKRESGMSRKSGEEERTQKICTFMGYSYIMSIMFVNKGIGYNVNNNKK